MRSYIRFMLVGLMSAGLLAACGGGDPPILSNKGSNSGSDGGGDGGNGGGGNGGGGTSGSGISYVPLSVFESSQEFSGFEQDGMFQGEVQFPSIKTYLINPIDAATLASVTTAQTTDYRTTVDGVEIDPDESYPLLQKVIGSQVQLRTALVFDVSDSVNDADMSALVTEARAYVAAAQGHSNPVIANQEFVVWVFGESVSELTAGFTSDSVAINAALDGVQSASLGTSSNLHRAVVEVVGRYVEDPDYDFGNDGDNDLYDNASSDGIFLSQMAIFSAGPDTFLEMDQELMQTAIESQSFLKYDQSPGAAANAMVYLKKPVFYYVMGGTTAGTAYTALRDLSETATNLILSGGVYSFSSSLINSQIAAIDARIDLDNQYVYRFAFRPRIGDHEVVFSSSNATGHSYALTSDFNEGDPVEPNDGIEDFADVEPVVEITTPSGEYISNSRVSFSDAQVFTAATRWTADSFAGVDYAWTLTGGTGVNNGDGTYTVTSIAGASATLRLTNNLVVSATNQHTILITND